MKFATRTFSVAFLLSGAFLASHSQQTSAAGYSHRAISHQTISVGMPPPSCPPNDPDGCQMGPVPKAR